MNSSNHATRSTYHNYKEMKDLSKDAAKDAARRLAVDEAGAGQRVDNFLLRRLKGVPKSHIYRILRSGEVRLNSRRVKPDARLAAGDLLRIPPLRTSAPSAERRKPPAPPRVVGPVRGRGCSPSTSRRGWRCTAAAG
jgi:hypothetical protein